MLTEKRARKVATVLSLLLGENSMAVQGENHAFSLALLVLLSDAYLIFG